MKFSIKRASLKSLREKRSACLKELEVMKFSIPDVSLEELNKNEKELRKKAESLWEGYKFYTDKVEGLKKQASSFFNRIFDREKVERLNKDINSFSILADDYFKKYTDMQDRVLRTQDLYIKRRPYEEKLSFLHDLEKEIVIRENAENKRLRERNKMAENTRQVREIAEDVKAKLLKNKYCPYCGRLINYNGYAHADHIYPIDKGGQSTIENMVYVCSDCNLKKGNMTLGNFIRKYNLDRNYIETQLINLNKDF